MSQTPEEPINGGRVSARIAQMRDAASAIEASARRVGDAIAAAEAEINGIGRERFISEGATAFYQTFDRMTPELRDASTYLLRFQEKLRLAADEIEAAARATGGETS